jgi:hypothetical protein
MGSGQSSTNNKDTSKTNKNTFAIDLDGLGDQPKPVKKQKKKKRGNNSRKVKDPSQEGKMAAEASQQQQQPQHQESAGFAAPLAAMGEMSSGMPQLSTLNAMPKAQPRSEDESYSLQELDVILERMRAMYRPRPVVLSGQSRGVFEEIEKNLVNCYSKHKDQPLECSKISRDYAAFVSEQRNRILRDATRKDSPLFT